MSKNQAQAEKITMTPDQLMTALTFALKYNHNMLITGAPGVGKSDIVTQATKALGYKLIISHPVVSDPTDYKGLPFPTKGENGTDKAEFLPFGELLELVNATEETVFFLDDLGQAPASVQAAAMQLLLARRINGHVVSDKVRFIAATNRRQDKAGVQGILEPVKSRFSAIVELKVEYGDWKKWALQNNMPFDLVSFINYRNDLLHDFQPSSDIVGSPCPRTWHFVGKMLNDGIPDVVEHQMIAGAVGDGPAAEFIAFRKIYQSLPNPDAIIMNPDSVDVPDDPATRFALCGALAGRASTTNLANVIKYTDRMGAEFSTMVLKDSFARDRSLATAKAFHEWCAANKNVIM